MSASILRLASLVLVLILPLFGCTESAQGQTYYDQPPPGYYGNPYQGYAPPPPPYDGGDSNYRAYEKRRRQVEANCNIGWQNCMNICNTIQDARQRNTCIRNCNHARHDCLRSY